MNRDGDRCIAVMQPYVFPYIGYFQLVASVDRFVFLDDVNYIKKGWINRNRIVANGQEFLFTIPLERMSQNKLICETMISADTSWKGKFLKTVERSYVKAPFFEHTYDAVRTMIGCETRVLSEFAENTIVYLSSMFGLSVKFLKASEYGNCSLRGEQRIVDICVREKATRYHNAIGGMELYRSDSFMVKGIELSFIKPCLISYAQATGDFLKGLSIIDVMMYNSVDAIKAMLCSYESVRPDIGSRNGAEPVSCVE